MTRRPIGLLLWILFVATRGWAQPGPAAAPPATTTTTTRSEVLQLATCPHAAGEFQATLRGQLVLARAFVATATKDEDEEIRASIKQQIRYLWGHFRTDAAAHRRLQVVLAGEEPELLSIRKSAGTYGRDLTLDWQETGQHLAITDPYTRRAVARGFIRRRDPALLLDYEVRFRVALCGREQPQLPSSLTVPLPRDPWLLFWHVPRAARRPMSYFGIVSVTNPCSDDDFAELPHPYYYWYDWMPGRHGPDARGASFDCRQLLRPGVDFVPHEVSLQPLPAPTAAFPRLRRALLAVPPGQREAAPVTATVLIGVLDHQWKDLGYPALRDEIGAGEDLSRRAREVLARPIVRERGTEKLVLLLRDLREVMDVARFDTSVERGYLRVEVSGALRRSQRPVRLRLFAGLTDVFGPTPPDHWFILSRALFEDNLVIYAGHSGLGENFRLAQIEDHQRLPHADFQRGYRAAPFQLIAFLSCYSYMYFGQDLLAAGTARAEPRGEFVFTGTEYTKGDRGALALLDLVDQVLAPGNDRATATPAARYLDPEDFWILKEAGRPAP